MIDQYLVRVVQNMSVSTKALLLAVNIFVVALLVVLWQMSVLPVAQMGVFVFFAVLVFLFALHRPRWAFWFFVGAVPLEIVNLAPDVLGLQVRPYQFIGAALIGAVVVRALSGRTVRRMFRWRWWDSAAAVFVGSSFVSAFFAQDIRGAFIQAVIASSFVAWYFLARYFVRGPVTARVPLMFFFASSVVSVFYGLWQNWQFLFGGITAVMAARPNATFTEPDWLGLFLVFMSALIYGVFYAMRLYYGACFAKYSNIHRVQISVLWVLLILMQTLLIITVARSAWLGAVCIVCVFFGYFVFRRDWHGLRSGVIVSVVASVFAYGVVVAIPLTTFNLGDRVQSTGSGLQTITVACDTEEHALALESRGQIDDIAQLVDFGCRHIDLEAVDAARAAGESVTHVVRPDPSSGARREIYAKVFTALHTNWQTAVFGTGWGQADLGQDTQGARLNASNIFLEVWLGAGIVGLGAFLALLGSILWRSLRAVYLRNVSRSVRLYGVFSLLGMCAILVPNMFNAGILLGFVWVFLGMMAGLRKV